MEEDDGSDEGMLPIFGPNMEALGMLDFGNLNIAAHVGLNGNDDMFDDVMFDDEFFDDDDSFDEYDEGNVNANQPSRLNNLPSSTGTKNKIRLENEGARNIINNVAQRGIYAEPGYENDPFNQ